MNKFFALIPVKLKSNSIYQKNLKKIKNKTLVDITIDEAKKSSCFDEIYVSSENYKLKKICEKKKIFFFKRNKIFSTKKALSSSVIQEFIKKKNLDLNDIIIYLQPTSPFRKAKHIKESIKKFKRHKKKTLISVKENSLNIFKSLIINSNFIKPLFNDKFPTMNRQSFPKTYLPNGAIYIFLVKEFKKKMSIPHHKSIPFLMDEKDSLDIDNFSDLKKARNT